VDNRFAGAQSLIAHLVEAGYLLHAADHGVHRLLHQVRNASATIGSASPSVEQQLAEIRALRESLGPHTYDPAEIDAAKREGRP
jgi:hypothetical protein